MQNNNPPPAKGRPAENNWLIGENGCGKSTALREFLAVRQRNLIIKPNGFDSTWDAFQEIDTEKILTDITRGDKEQYFDVEDFFKTNNSESRKLQRRFKLTICEIVNSYNSGVRTIICEHPEVYNAIIHNKRGFRDGSLINDDFKSTITHNAMTTALKKLMISFRHKMVDLYFAVHSPDDVPPGMMGHRPVIWQFRCTGSYLKHREKFLNYDELIEIQKKVNKISNSNPYYAQKVKMITPDETDQNVGGDDDDL